jgi:hypothetical protein
MNQYGYCWNNPLVLVDLDGLVPTPFGPAPTPTPLPQWVKNLGQGMSNARNNTITAVNNVWNTTTTTVNNAWNTTTTTVNNAWNTTTTAVNNTWNYYSTFMKNVETVARNNITFDLEYGVGIAVGLKKGFIKPEVGLTVHNVNSFNFGTGEFDVNNWNVEGSFGVLGSGPLEDIGIGTGWNHQHGTNTTFIGVMLPDSLGISLNEIDNDTPLISNGDFALTLGGRLYFGIGGGGSVTFNFSEFWRQLNEISSENEKDY